MRQQRGVLTIIAFGLALGAAVALISLVFFNNILMAAAVALFVATLAISLVSPQAALFSLIFAGLLEGLYKGLAPSLFSLLVKDIFLGLLFLRLFWFSQSTRDFSWLRQPFTAPAAAFSLYCIAMMFAPSTRSILLALAGLRAWLLWMPVYYPVYHLFDNRKVIMNVLTVLMYIQFPICVYGIIQGNIGYEHMRFIPGFYEQTRRYGTGVAPDDPSLQGGEGQSAFEEASAPIMNVRACSIYNTPADLGVMASLTVLLALGMLGMARTPGHRLFFLLTALAGAGAQLASGSRAPMVGLVVGLMAMTLVSRRKGMVVLGIAIIAFSSLYMLRDITGGGAVRLEQKLTIAGAFERSMYPLKIGWKQGLAHPLGNGIATGVGMGRVFYSAGLEAARGTRWVENEFGRALTELGFVGTALWMWMVLGAMGLCVKAIRSLGLRREGMLAAGMFGFMVAIFTQLGVGSALYGANGGMYFWIFAAAIIRLSQIAKAEPVYEPTVNLSLPARPHRYGFIRTRDPMRIYR